MSTQPVLGVLSFLASDTYKENEKLIHALIGQIRSWRGLKRIYEGISVDEEDPDRRWLIVVWDTHENSNGVLNDSALPIILENLGICTAWEGEMHHVRFSDTTVMALASPTTEIAELQLKDIKQRSSFEEHMHHFMQHAHNAPRAKEHSPFAFGETYECSNFYLFIGGWNSKQAHLDCVADPEGIKHEVEKIGDYTAIKVHHFRAKEYTIN